MVYACSMSFTRMRCCLYLLLLPLAACATVHVKINPDTGLTVWKTEGQAFSLELVQVLPDYVRAVYTSRGLPGEIVDKVSSYCVFGTILRNESDGPLAYRVSDWRYITPDGAVHPIRTKSMWVREWREMGVAFRWSMLPDDQTFEVGDWGQGFTTFELPPGSRFDLQYSWSEREKTYTRTIRDLRCAPADLPER